MKDPACVPTFHFDFSDGLNSLGTYTRTTPHFDGGLPKRFGFSLDDATLFTPIGIRLVPVFADLIDVCSAVSIANRRSPRNVCNDTSGPRLLPKRRIRITIGVRCRSLWQRPEIREDLELFLADLSHDDWEITFVSRTSTPRRSEAQEHLFGRRIPESPIVALHSGGMDSFLGLVGAINRAEADAVLAVSVISHPRVRTLTHAVVDSIQSVSGHQVPVLIGLQSGLHHVALSKSFADRESSQRTRILPCLAVGVAVAAMTGSDELQVTENGIGAFNLRYTPGHNGAMMNRAMHPQTLHRFARIASEVIGRSICIVNDGLFQTKGQLLTERMGDQFKDALQKTASCERIPWSLADEPCGTCSSCLLRRMSLRAAGLRSIDDDVARRMQVNVLSDTFDLDHDNAVPLLAFAAQADDLRRALDHVRPDQELRKRFPELARNDGLAESFGLSSQELRRTVVKLYRQHLREWDKFAASVPSFRQTTSQLPLPLDIEQVPVAG